MWVGFKFRPHPLKFWKGRHVRKTDIGNTERALLGMPLLVAIYRYNATLGLEPGTVAELIKETEYGSYVVRVDNYEFMVSKIKVLP